MTTGSVFLRMPALPRGDAMWLVIVPAVALAAWLALMPVAFLVWQSFFTPETASAPAAFTFENYLTAYLSTETFRLFGNSVTFGLGSAAVAFVSGTFFAWVNERTDTPFKSLFFALSLVPLVIPAILFTVSWIFLASPKIGIINSAVGGLFGTDTVFVDIYSLGGMVFVDGMHQSPLAFLLMSAAFRAMDPALEESALMSGASVREVVWRVTLRLAWPAALAAFLILFVRAVESFEVPALLGLPVGIEVYTSSIYQAIQKYPSEVGLASAYGVTLLLIASLCIFVQSRVAADAGRFSTVTGKGFRPRRMRIGAWRYATAAVFVAYLMVIVVLPFLVLVWCSLQKFYSTPSLAALHNLTFEAYRTVALYPEIASVVRNTAVLAVGTA
ncbi:MAG: iron ABC transporter permease, partial [Xanthobacteraceae bacterium]|nr:iron ABC transporter permease [Xanthobacteraceae bacterium]